MARSRSCSASKVELGSTIEEQHESGTRSRKRSDGEVAERTPATRPAEPIVKS